eukprot:Rmarinus@m.3157
MEYPEACVNYVKRACRGKCPRLHVPLDNIFVEVCTVDGGCKDNRKCSLYHPSPYQWQHKQQCFFVDPRGGPRRYMPICKDFLMEGARADHTKQACLCAHAPNKIVKMVVPLCSKENCECRFFHERDLKAYDTDEESSDSHTSLSREKSYKRGFKTVETIEDFLSAVNKRNKVFEAILTGLELTDDDAVVVGRSMTGNPNVRDLDLSRNAIGGSGVTAVCDALMRNWALKTLMLDRNLVGSNGARSLGFLLARHPALRRLSLREAHIEEHDVLFLAEGLKTNTSLRQLDLTMNCIGDRGADSIAVALKSNKTLMFLTLDCCGIGPSGAAAIGDSLVSNSSLAFLSLNYNAIDEPGVASIAHSLRYNNGLRELGLSGNDVNDKSASQLAMSVIHNKALQRIDLQENCITKNGVDSLRECMKYNTAIVEISLDGNPVSAPGRESPYRVEEVVSSTTTSGYPSQTRVDYSTQSQLTSVGDRRPMPRTFQEALRGVSAFSPSGSSSMRSQFSAPSAPPKPMLQGSSSSVDSYEGNTFSGSSPDRFPSRAEKDLHQTPSPVGTANSRSSANFSLAVATGNSQCTTPCTTKADGGGRIRGIKSSDYLQIFSPISLPEPHQSSSSCSVVTSPLGSGSIDSGSGDTGAHYEMFPSLLSSSFRGRSESLISPISLSTDPGDSAASL